MLDFPIVGDVLVEAKSSMDAVDSMVNSSVPHPPGFERLRRNRERRQELSKRKSPSCGLPPLCLR